MNPSPPSPPRHAERRAALLAEYGEVANNFRLLTDIRFRLLAFLPIAAGTAAGLLAAGTGGDPASQMRALVLSVFGLTVTLALATYNLRNDQLYDTLISRAASIERELGLPDGAFANRSTDWFALRRWKVSHRWPVFMIYGASAALWLYSALAACVQLLVDGDKSAGPVALGIAAGAAALVTVRAGLFIYRSLDARREEMREDAKAAVERVIGAGNERDKLAECSAFVSGCARLGGIEDEQVKDRIGVYTDPEQEERNRRYFPASSADQVDSAAAFVALLSDLPPEWIADSYTGRRGS